MQIVEPKPWVIGQELTGTNGMAFVATGPNSFKMAAPEAPEPPEEDPPRQITFCPGDTLPDWMTGKVRVCLTTGEFVNLCDGEILPEIADGTVIVDPVTGKPTFNQKPKKPEEQIKNYVEQSEEPTKDQVDSGICIWRNSDDGCLYTVTINDDGSCTWYSSDKGDTNTFATVIEAPAAGVDDYDNSYSAGADLIVFADGTQMCQEKKDELGPRIVVDTDDPNTWPATSGQYEMQVLVNAAGEKVGCVDQFGPHLIADEDDEVGPNVTVDPTDSATWPTEPVSPHAVQFLCDADGNFCGIVTLQGSKKMPLADEVITPDGQPVAQEPVTRNDIVTQCCTITEAADADGNVTNPADPTGPRIPSGFPAGTMVTTSTDQNGANPVSQCVQESLKKCVVTDYDQVACEVTTEDQPAVKNDVFLTEDSILLPEEAPITQPTLDGGFYIHSDRIAIQKIVDQIEWSAGEFEVTSANVNGDVIFDQTVTVNIPCATWSQFIANLNFGRSTAGQFTVLPQLSINGGPLGNFTDGAVTYGSYSAAANGLNNASSEIGRTIFARRNFVKGENTVRFVVTVFVNGPSPNLITSNRPVTIGALHFDHYRVGSC